MKKFTTIQDALNFAALNRHSLKFPFTCRCSGISLKVLSPVLARTIDRDRPTLVVTRNESDVLELAYVVSVDILKRLLQSMTDRDRQYDLLTGGESVTVLCHAGSRPGSRFSFPLVKRTAEAAAAEGDYVLLLAKAQGSDWHRFWSPLETRLLHSSITSEA